VRRSLLIGYYFAPSGGPGVQRILKFARYLPEYGWLPTVLTVDHKYAAVPSIDESLFHEVPPEVKVIRTRAWDPFNFYSRIQGKKKEQVIKVGHIEKEQGLNKIARWLRGNIFLPDARVGWVPFASQIARNLVQEQKFDAIMSTGPPHSSHLIGMAATKASGLPWVADFRDPWVEIYYSDQMYETSLARNIQIRIERKVLSKANAVVAVSKHVGVGLKRRAAIKRYEMIPNGYDPADIPRTYTVTKRRDKFIIAYVGTYNLRRHSEAFVRALKQLQILDSVEVHLVGKIENEALKSYQTNKISVKKINYLPHGDAIAYMQSADVLLLSLPKVDGHGGAGIVSGKVFEYMSTRRPILAIGPEDGDLATLLHDTQAGEIFDHKNQKGIFRFLNQCLESRGNSWIINDAVLAEFERPRLTGRLAHLLDQLCKSN